MTRRTLEKIMYGLGWAIPMLLAAGYAALRCFGIPVGHAIWPCLFHMLTGLYCPGCGGTRAVLYLLKGRLWTSFCFHPIVPYAAALYLWFLASHTIERCTHGRKKGMRFRESYLWIALALVVANALVKNIALVGWGIDLLHA